MAIVFNRSKKEYTNIKNSLLKDKNLTFGARGLISLMLSRPDGWDFNMKEISSNTKESHYAVQKMIKELEECLYLFRVKRGIKGQKGKFEWLYFLSHTPFTESELEDIRKEFLNDNKDLRQCENATIVNNDNRKLGSYINTENYNNTEKNKKIDKINQSTLEDDKVKFRKNLREYINIVSKSTGLDVFRIENVITPSLFKDIEISEVLKKIKESDYLQGLKEDKPKIGNFTTKSMINRILVDSYKNNDKKQDEKNRNWGRVL